MARQIIVDIIGDTSKFDKSVDAASGKTKSFSNVIKGVGMGIGTAAFDLAAGAVSNLVSTLGDAATAYREDQVSQAKLGQALKNNIPNWDGNTDAIEEVIAARMRLGFSDEEQRDSLSQLVGATGDATEALKWQQAAMDLSRLKGIDLATATDIVNKAYMGNYRGLKSVGIELDANATKGDAYAAILGVAGGQAEAFAATSEGRQLAAQMKIGESMEQIGGVVDQVSSVALPILADAFTQIVTVVGELWTAIQPLVEEVIKELQPAFNAIIEVGQTVFGLFKQYLPNAIALLRSAFERIKPIIQTYISIVTTVIKTMLKVAEVVIPIVITALGILGDIFTGIWNTVSGVIDNMTKGWNFLVSFFTKLPGRIGDATRGMWDGIWKAFKGVINTIIRGWNSLKFTVPSIDMGPLGKIGGFTVGTPNIPYLHQGGIVPGSAGEDVVAILQAGERVIPRNQAGAGVININFYGPVYGDEMDELARRLATRIRLVGG